MDYGKVVAYNIPPRADTATVAFEQTFPCENAESGTKYGVANDLVMDKYPNALIPALAGYAYVTDTVLGKVYLFDRRSIELLVTDPLLQSVSPPFGANGILRVSPEVLIVGNNGNRTHVRVDLKTKKVENIVIDQTIGNPDGMLFLKDKRVVVVTGTKLFVLVHDGGWRKAKVIEVVDIDQSKDGEFATTATVGSNDCEIFITYVRFGDIFGSSVNANAKPSLVGRVMLDCTGRY